VTSPATENLLDAMNPDTFPNTYFDDFTNNVNGIVNQAAPILNLLAAVPSVSEPISTFSSAWQSAVPWISATTHFFNDRTLFKSQLYDFQGVFPRAGVRREGQGEFREEGRAEATGKGRKGEQSGVIPTNHLPGGACPTGSASSCLSCPPARPARGSCHPAGSPVSSRPTGSAESRRVLA